MWNGPGTVRVSSGEAHSSELVNFESPNARSTVVVDEAAGCILLRHLLDLLLVLLMMLISDGMDHTSQTYIKHIYGFHMFPPSIGPADWRLESQVPTMHFAMSSALLCLFRSVHRSARREALVHGHRGPLVEPTAGRRLPGDLGVHQDVATLQQDIPR